MLPIFFLHEKFMCMLKKNEIQIQFGAVFKASTPSLPLQMRYF